MSRLKKESKNEIEIQALVKKVKDLEMIYGDIQKFFDYLPRDGSATEELHELLYDFINKVDNAKSNLIEDNNLETYL